MENGIKIASLSKFGALAAIAAVGLGAPALAQDQKKPNILFIMGDDIGWMQPSIYHKGLMVCETPNIDVKARSSWITTPCKAVAVVAALLARESNRRLTSPQTSATPKLNWESEKWAESGRS